MLFRLQACLCILAVLSYSLPSAFAGDPPGTQSLTLDQAKFLLDHPAQIDPDRIPEQAAVIQAQLSPEELAKLSADLKDAQFKLKAMQGRQTQQNVVGVFWRSLQGISMVAFTAALLSVAGKGMRNVFKFKYDGIGIGGKNSKKEPTPELDISGVVKCDDLATQVPSGIRGRFNYRNLSIALVVSYALYLISEHQADLNEASARMTQADVDRMQTTISELSDQMASASKTPSGAQR